VRERAYRQYGSRDVRILETDTGGVGRRETVSGTVEVRDGNRAGSYRFSCLVNANQRAGALRGDHAGVWE
jgi:hypothetical protein